jgi:hypothetical protein
MSIDQDDLKAIEDLSEKLGRLYSKNLASKRKKPPACEIQNEILRLTVANSILPDSAIEKKKSNEKKIKALEKELQDDLINIAITESDLCLINLAMVYLKQSYEANQYVKDSTSTGISSQKRWERVAEIMLIKNPDEKRLPKYSDDLFINYWALTRAGISPSKASEEVCKKFNITDQEDCDKWLQRKVVKRQKECPEVYGNILKPNTYPRLK